MGSHDAHSLSSVTTAHPKNAIVRCTFFRLHRYLSRLFQLTCGRPLIIQSLNFPISSIAEVTVGSLNVTSSSPTELCLEFAVSHQCSKGALCQHVHVPLTACLARDRYILQALHTISEVGLPSEGESFENWSVQAAQWGHVYARQATSPPCPVISNTESLSTTPRATEAPVVQEGATAGRVDSIEELLQEIEVCKPMELDEWRALARCQMMSKRDTFESFRNSFWRCLR